MIPRAWPPSCASTDRKNQGWVTDKRATGEPIMSPSPQQMIASPIPPSNLRPLSSLPPFRLPIPTSALLICGISASCSSQSIHHQDRSAKSLTNPSGVSRPCMTERDAGLHCLGPHWLSGRAALYLKATPSVSETEMGITEGGAPGAAGRQWRNPLVYMLFRPANDGDGEFPFIR